MTTVENFNAKIQKQNGFDSFCVNEYKGQTQILVCYVIKKDCVRAPSGGCFIADKVGTFDECVNYLKGKVNEVNFIRYENLSTIISTKIPVPIYPL